LTSISYIDNTCCSYIRGGQSGEDVSAVDFKVLSFSSILRAINICLSKVGLSQQGGCFCLSKVGVYVSAKT